MARKRFGYRQIDKDGGRSYAEAQLENPDAGFYRLRHFEGKLLHEKLPFYKPTNPQTEAQQAWRAVFTAGKNAYDALSPEELLYWRSVGTKKRLTAYNAFQSNYLNTHKS